MKEQLALQKLLTVKYEELRAKNPQFSRRSFSKRLGISPGALSELLNGQRQVSLKLAQRIADRLGVDPVERAELFSLFPVSRRRRAPDAEASGDAVDSTYLQLSADQFRVIGDWYHFAILTLMRTSEFRCDPVRSPEWFARRLGLSPKVAQTAMTRLKRLELIQEDADGRLRLTQTRFRTSDDVSNVSVRRAHAQSLDRAREALDTLGVKERDFSSLMVCLSPERLAQIKERIRKFQSELLAEIEDEGRGGNEVYQLCVQLFPLTKFETDGVS